MVGNGQEYEQDFSFKRYQLAFLAADTILGLWELTQRRIDIGRYLLVIIKQLFVLRQKVG